MIISRLKELRRMDKHISRRKELRRMDKLRVRKCKEKPNKNEDYNN